MVGDDGRPRFAPLHLDLIIYRRLDDQIDWEKVKQIVPVDEIFFPPSNGCPDGSVDSVQTVQREDSQTNVEDGASREISREDKHSDIVRRFQWQSTENYQKALKRSRAPSLRNATSELRSPLEKR